MAERKIEINGGTSGRGPQEKEPELGFQVVDRRPFADPDRVPSVTEEKPRYPTFVEELMAKLSESERRFEQRRNQVDEEIAKMKNRLEADYERKVELQRRELLIPFLEVLDNLERAIEAARAGGTAESLLQGVEMTVSLFRSKLRAEGVEEIQLLGEPFDPNLGQAVGVVEVQQASKDGKVVEEIRKGYRLGDLLLRPAQVRVGRSSARASEGSTHAD